MATDAGQSLHHAHHTMTTRKFPILSAAPIEAMTAQLGIAVPEMIFGDNSVIIQNPKAGWALSFNTFDGLDRVDKTGEKMLQVRHSEEWKRTRTEQHRSITEVIKPFDWSYTTDYKGTIHSPIPTLDLPPSTTSTNSNSTYPPQPPSPRYAFRPTSTPIPLSLLRRPDPILLYDDVPLYEDEMADNGITSLDVKIRVMPARLLLLCRFFMRLDGVLIRIRDTRVYVEFSTGQVLREYTAREEKYETVRERLASGKEDVLAAMRDPGKMAEVLPVVESSLEELVRL